MVGEGGVGGIAPPLATSSIIPEPQPPTKATPSAARPRPSSGERRSLRKIAAELAKIGEAQAATGLPSAKEADSGVFRTQWPAL